jgi:hypothetical protein
MLRSARPGRAGARSPKATIPKTDDASLRLSVLVPSLDRWHAADFSAATVAVAAVSVHLSLCATRASRSGAPKMAF